MRKLERKKAPSRIRYEQSHPTVSCRVPLDLYERLDNIRREEGTGCESPKNGLINVQFDIPLYFRVRRSLLVSAKPSCYALLVTASVSNSFI